MAQPAASPASICNGSVRLQAERPLSLKWTVIGIALDMAVVSPADASGGRVEAARMRVTLAQPLGAERGHLLDISHVVVQVEGESQQIAADAEPHAGRLQAFMQCRHFLVGRRVVVIAEAAADGDDMAAGLT